MASLANIYFKLETLEQMVKNIRLNGYNGVSIDLSINDTANNYEQNISAYLSQTKEQRQAKEKKIYVANGNVFWTDGNIVAIKKENKQNNNSSIKSNTVTQNAIEEAEVVSDDLPF